MLFSHATTSYDEGRAMDGERSRRPAARRPLIASVTGLGSGLLAGAALLAIAGTAVAHRLASAPDADPGRLIDASHLAPLLTVSGEPVVLRYDVYCAPPNGDVESGAPCNAAGNVYVRPGQSGAFRPIPLRPDPAAVEGRYRADVPAEIASSSSGFTYYAVLRNAVSGAELTMPAGGASAPQRSLPIAAPTRITLGSHVFGAARSADARVASATWGGGVHQVGLEGGPESQPIGASSFDVDPGGAVTVLDEAKKRALRWLPGAAKPVSVPLSINGTIADLAVASDGTMYVLESAGQSPGRGPLLRSFDATGRQRGAWQVAERTAAQVRVGASGPVVLQYPSGQWMPVASGGGGLSATEQARLARPGRPLRDGSEVVVLRTGNEVRVAVLGPGGVRRSWRIESSTPLAEVQLADPVGDRLVVVLRAYDDDQSEFVVLVLDPRGLVKWFAVDSADWAETAPLSRFRLVGSSLYRLGSTPAGVFVDRFGLEVS
jgi:hypothetical protein